MRSKFLICGGFVLSALVACATSSPPAHQGVNPAPVAGATVAAPNSRSGYLDPASLDLYRLLPPPPVAGSAQERAELDELLRIQAERTPAQAKRAADDATVSIFRFADALGAPSQFTQEHLPLTTALFRRIGRDESAFVNPAKNRFDRPRPYLTETRIAPVLLRDPSPSYPSGHSTWASACAIVLADMLPEDRSALFLRAAEYARNRTVAGVHYPSDVAAGQRAGAALAALLYSSPRFRADEAAAAAELRAALGLPPKP